MQENTNLGCDPLRLDDNDEYRWRAPGAEPRLSPACALFWQCIGARERQRVRTNRPGEDVKAVGGLLAFLSIWLPAGGNRFAARCHARLGMRTTRLDVILSVFLLLSTTPLFITPSPAFDDSTRHNGRGEYETRREQLLDEARKPFIDDRNREVETALDRRPFQALLNLDCPKLLDNSNGWSVEVRSGGRPFMNFEHIRRNGTPWPFAPCTPGNSNIPQRELDAHHEMEKMVNRLWFVHRTGRDTDPRFPVVVVITADGFMNVGGADRPLLQGAATRYGFIHEPFTPSDFLQHIDNIDITVINDNIVLVTFDIHSEAGEGVLEVELRWIEDSQQPELHFRSAHVLRSNLPTSTLNIGVAGFNFMRGPTLHGLQFDALDDEIRDGGIEAFHDGRTIFVDPPTGPVIRRLLTPQVSTHSPVLEEIATDVMVGTRLVLDQTQHQSDYFSRFPGHPHYEHRTDLILSIVKSSTEPIGVRSAQVPANLQDVNPEANETVNVYYAVDMTKNVAYDFEYTLALAAQDFEQHYTDLQPGVIFTSDREENHAKLFYLPLDTHYLPAALPVRLTDGVISDPRRPSVSLDRRYIMFDAQTYRPYDISNQEQHRIHILDRLTGVVHRRTLDPFGTSHDIGGSLSADTTQFVFITTRSGVSSLNIEQVGTGLGFGTGNAIEEASGADWCQSQDEIVFTNNLGLFIHDLNDQTTTSVIAGSGLETPKFSPDCMKVAYQSSSDLYIIERQGLHNTLVSGHSRYPAWIDDHHLIIERTIAKNTDLYLLQLKTGNLEQLTTHPGLDQEPVFVTGHP